MTRPPPDNSWNEVGTLLVSVLDLPPEERPAFLDAACQDRPALRAEVDALLAAYRDAPAFFDGLASGLLPDLASAPAPPPPTDPHRLAGQHLGPYLVDALLGRGGMGLVYRATDTRLGRAVALKFLPPALSSHPVTKQRFLAEARAVATLDHPHICTLYEVGETDDGHPFIAMALYQGETLQHRLERGPLPVEEALAFTLQAAHGLAQAHTHGIIHRDVKPGNLFLTQDERLKVLDFGLAKMAGHLQLTRTGATLGTAAYMAPEQARGEPVDHRADIWSLGVVLYEMLTGQRPFDGDFGPAVVYAVLNDDPEPVTGLRTGLPMQLGLIVQKMLAKQPAARYQRMDEVIGALDGLRAREAARSRMEAAVRPTAAPEAAPDPFDDDGPLHLLVVDDEPELELLVRQRFRRRLRKGDWTLAFAGSGREALALLAARPEIALVLTDINMPGMDGLTLLGHIAEIDRPIKTIIVSAYGDMDNIRTAMNRGAFDFITKPINFSDLETTIEKTHAALQMQRRAEAAEHRLVGLQKEFEVARRIQEALLPLAFPTRDDLDLYAYTTTARDVGGTFYDFFPVGAAQFGFVVGDVAGKGVPAALFMAMCQTFLKGIAVQGEAPGACLTALNRLLFPEGFADLTVTVFYGLLDPATGMLAFANAGHPAPYQRHAEGSLAPLSPADGPIWQRREATFATHTTTLRPGDGLFVFTRHVLAAPGPDGHPFSAERLATLLRTAADDAPAALIRTVVRAVMAHSEDLRDDLTLLALRYLGR